MRNEEECVCSKIMSVCVCSKIIKELPGLVGSGTPCTSKAQTLSEMKYLILSSLLNCIQQINLHFKKIFKLSHKYLRIIIKGNLLNFVYKNFRWVEYLFPCQGLCCMQVQCEA